MSPILLEARGLTTERAAEGGRHRVLDGVDLSLARGEIVDISGPSGSGKTTLLRALASMLPGVTGELSLEGLPIATVGLRVWRTRVALLPQRATMFPGTVRDNLLVPWNLKVRHGVAAPTESALRGAVDSIGLAEIALDREAARLSVGQAARVALLRVALTHPDVLLLDEPDANLDEDSAAQVAEGTRRFAERGAVIRVRHQRADGVATRRLRLASGRLEEVADGR